MNSNSVNSITYKCQKCKKELKDTVHRCSKCEIPYHPGCYRFHKIKNTKGEFINCTTGFETIDLKNKEMEVVNGVHLDETQVESIDTCEQTMGSDNSNGMNYKRKRKAIDECNDDNEEANDEERLHQLIQDTIKEEVRPLIKKIDALLNEIVESKCEIVNLKKIINRLTNENSILQIKNNNNQVESSKVKVTYANVVENKNTEAVIVVKPVGVEVDLHGNVNVNKKNINLNNVKNNINVKELGVGITSIKEKNNGTVIVRCKNVNDRDKLQKDVIDKIGEKFNVQIPKTKKKFVKVVWIDKDEATLTDDEIINNIIQQNKISECSDNVKMKIVKRIINDKKNDFSVIIKVNPELQKMLLFLEKICLGWKQCKVVEHINILRCFKCCGYNHYANDCKREIHCGKCGGAHDSNSCQSKFLKCINCANKKKNSKDVNNIILNDNHNAFDKTCPIYIKLAEIHKKRADENM